MTNSSEKWFEHLEQPTAYTSYYKEPEDKLNISLERIKIEGDKAEMLIWATLAKFPDTPPTNWILNAESQKEEQNTYVDNAARINLHFGSILSLELEDTVTYYKAEEPENEKRVEYYLGYPVMLNPLEISISRLEDNSLFIKACGEDCSFKVICLSVKVEQIYSYNKENAVYSYW